MTSDLLVSALRRTIVEAVDRSVDGIIRVDIDSEIPIGAALAGVIAEIPDATIGLLDRRYSLELESAGIQFERDAQMLTRLRNDATRTSAMVCLGSATGPGQQGLRDLAVVVRRMDLLANWQETLIDVLAENFVDRDLEIRIDVTNAMFSLLEDQSRTIRSVDSYFDASMTSPGSSLTLVQQELWKIGLFPDENLIAASIAGRLMSNVEKISSLLEDSESAEKQRSRLVASDDPRVLGFLKYFDSGNIEELSTTDFKAILDALKSDRPPVRRSDSTPSLIDVLSNGDVDRAELLHAVTEALPPLDRLETIDITVDAPVPVRLVVEGGRDQMRPWTESVHEADDDEGHHPTATNPIFATLRLIDAENRSRDFDFLTSYLIDQLRRNVSDERIDEFVVARSKVLEIGFHLASNDLAALTFLVAYEEALEVSERYVVAWQRLLLEFAECPHFEGKENVGVLLALGDGIWSRQLQAHETFESPVITQSDIYDSVRLSQFHPWRLDPLAILARQVTNGIRVDPRIATAAAWAVDKAIPIFRVLRVGPNVLNFATREGGVCEFLRESEDTFPPISSKIPELRRTFAAYERTHPWARAGATVSFVNPPVGGLIKQTEEMLRSVFGHSPQLLVIRDSTTRGVDRDIDITESIEVFDFDDIESAQPLREIGRDITVCFLAGFRARSHLLGEGAHGPIDIALAARGLGPQGALFVPRIELRPDDRNETISLLHRVSGVEGTCADTFDLALPLAATEILPVAAGDSEWIVVGVPAFVSAFPVIDESGNEFHPLTEFDNGDYRFFVLARSVEPIGESVRQRMAELPISSPRMAEVRDLVNSLAESLPKKVFDVALNRFGAEEALGLISARAIAIANADDDDLILELSLDHASWAQQLVGDEHRRADLIVVRVSSDRAAEVPIVLTVVEAKASTSPFITPRVDREPFTEAIGQAEATRDFLIQVFSSAGESLLGGIQLRTFIEQLAAGAASSYMADDREDRAARFETYFSHISALSSVGRSVPPIESLVVSTFLDGIQEMQLIEDVDVRMVAASSRLLEQVLRGEFVAWPEPSRPPEQAPGLELVRESDASGRPSDRDDSLDLTAERESENIQVGVLDAGDSSDAVDQLVDSVARVLRLRTESVGSVDRAETSVGPTFVSISLPFERGAALAPLQRSELDIARDLGVTSVEIGNDEVSGRIRILVPRLDRQFPALIPSAKYEGEAAQYLPLMIGQDLEGVECRAPISTWPHALVAGSTGSGKTTFLRSLLAQLDAWGPDRSRVVIVDGKGETDYFGIVSDSLFLPDFPAPQLAVDDAVSVLDWLMEQEVPRRKRLMLEIAKSQSGRVDAREIFVRAMVEQSTPPFVPLVVVIDEFNEIMIRGGSSKDRFVRGVTSVAQTARSVLVHLVLATQRPDRTVVPGAIKANLPARFAFRLPTAADSVTVLGHGGAEKLLGWGDMLLQLNGERDRRLQSFLVP